MAGTKLDIMKTHYFTINHLFNINFNLLFPQPIITCSFLNEDFSTAFYFEIVIFQKLGKY